MFNVLFCSPFEQFVESYGDLSSLLLELPILDIFFMLFLLSITKLHLDECFSLSGITFLPIKAHHKAKNSSFI